MASLVALSAHPNALILRPGTFEPALGATAMVYEYVPPPGTPGTPVTVYADATGASTLSQPIPVDSNGLLLGYVAAGQDLSIIATYGGVTAPPAIVVPLRGADLIGTDGKVGGAGSLGLPPSVVSDSSSTNASADYAVIKEAPLNVDWAEFGGVPDGTTDNTAAINAAILKAFGSGVAQQATLGGEVLLPPGPRIAAGIVLKSGVRLTGVGRGGQVYSDTDSGVPPAGTFLKLKPGATIDLIVTDNFATLNPSPGSATAYNTPARCGISHMVLDGNRWGAPSGGRCLSAFARGLVIEDVVFQNAPGADGVYVNGPTDSNETELMMSKFRIVNCVGNGLNLQGAHDLIIDGAGLVNNNGGIGVIEGPNLGTALFSDIHVYGNAGYNWQLGCAWASHQNCISDGTPGVQVLANGVTWDGGAIYGTISPHDELICLGDGTARTVQGCRFTTPIFQLGLGGRMFRYRSNTTIGYNKFLSNANLNGNNAHLFAADGYATASGPVASTATTITVTQSATPVQNGAVIISDGSHAVSATVSSGGGTGTLTLSTQLGTAMNSGAGNISVWNTASIPADWFELSDAPSGSTGFYQQYDNPAGSVTRTFYGAFQIDGTFRPGDGVGHVGGAIYSGSGAPTRSGNSGDYYFRTDTPTTANQRLYVCTGGTSWTAIL